MIPRQWVRKQVIPYDDLGSQGAPVQELYVPDDMGINLSLLVGYDGTKPHWVRTNANGVMQVASVAGSTSGSVAVNDSVGNPITTANPFPVDLETIAGHAPDSTHTVPTVNYDGSGNVLGGSLTHPEISQLAGPTPALTQLIASRTDTGSVNLGPFNAGGYYHAIFLVRVTANVALTSASFFYGVQDHNAIYYGAFTGPVITTNTTGFMRIGIGTTLPIYDPFYIQMNLVGTSVTWYMDVIYH